VVNLSRPQFHEATKNLRNWRWNQFFCTDWLLKMVTQLLPAPAPMLKPLGCSNVWIIVSNWPEADPRKFAPAFAASSLGFVPRACTNPSERRHLVISRHAKICLEVGENVWFKSHQARSSASPCDEKRKRTRRVGRQRQSSALFTQRT
jgi:hypothetical protein